MLAGAAPAAVPHCVTARRGTTDARMDLMLIPPKRALQQVALAVICGIIEDDKSITGAEQPGRNFPVESVLPLREQDAKTATASLLKLISLIALARQTASSKREF